MSLIATVEAIQAEIKHNMEARDRLVLALRQTITDRRAMLETEEKIAENNIAAVEKEFADRDAALRKLIGEA